MKANKNILDVKPSVPGKPIEEVQRELGISKVVKLASNENNLGVPKRVIEKVQSKLKDLFLYPDGSCFKLRSKLAEQLGVDNEQLIFGNGSDEILQIIALAYLGQGNSVLIANGTFSEYDFVARLLNADRTVVPLKDYTYDLPGFAKSVGDDTNVIFLCNPNNPTGTYFTANELEIFLDKVPSTKLVVLDEAYYEYAYGDDYPETIPLLNKHKNIIILRTFSKVYALAGCRIGYGIASKEIIDVLNRARQPFNINSIAQECALAVLDEAQWVEEVRQANNEQKKYLYKEFDKLGLKYFPTKANFIFIDLQKDAQVIFQALMKLGVIIRPMTGFGFPMAIRVSIGLPEENKFFIECLNKVLSST
jgi:histidinol-phosphate aminotransferase